MAKTKPEETKTQEAPKKDPMKKYYIKNKYDPYSLKFSLDEYITDTLEKKYPTKEIHRFSTHKISLGILLVALMLLSHFYPLKFPQNFYLLLGCCLGYYVLSGIYTYYDEKVIKDTFIAFLYPFEKTETAKTKFIKFGSKIELFSDTYVFTAEYRPNNQNVPPQKVEHRLYVGDYFDAKGKPDFAAIDKFLNNVMNSFKTA